MGLFNRKRKEDLSIQPPASSRVVIEAHKAASAEEAEKAKVATQHVNDLLADGGVELKIYLAAGGRLRQSKQGGKS